MKRVDLSAGAAIALAAVCGALAMHSTASALVGLLTCLAVGTDVGAINGFGVSLVRIQPFIMTFGMLLTARALAFLLTRGMAIGMLPESVLREVERAPLVRSAVGPHVRLMADVNERWSVGRAIDIGRRLEEIGLYCLEDPTRADDYAGLARIAAALSTPVMAGESAWGLTPFRLMLESRSIDIVMIDLMHVGGITPWMKIAAMAEAFNIPVVSHIMPEFQAQLVAAAPNGLIVEHKAWTWRLFEGVPELDRDEFILSDRPGHGLSISREFEKLT